MLEGFVLENMTKTVINKIIFAGFYTVLYTYVQKKQKKKQGRTYRIQSLTFELWNVGVNTCKMFMADEYQWWLKEYFCYGKQP